MKTTVLVVLVIAVVSTAAFAQGAPRKGAFGTQVAGTITSTGGSPSGALGAKYMITDAIGIRAMLGFLNDSGTSTTGYDFLAGFEYHLATKGGTSPYIGAELGYSGESISGATSTPSDFGLRALFGAEYFFSSNFSWGGELKLGFDSFSTAAPVTTTTRLFTAVATTLTWYLN